MWKYSNPNFNGSFRIINKTFYWRNAKRLRLLDNTRIQGDYIYRREGAQRAKLAWNTGEQ
jgi:hypothetical protein